MNAALVLQIGRRAVTLHDDQFFRGYQYGCLEWETRSQDLTDVQIYAHLVAMLMNALHHDTSNAGRVLGWVQSLLEGDSRPPVPSAEFPVEVPQERSYHGD